MPLTSIWTIFLRIVIIYFLALLFIRLMGKRELYRLSAFDFIIAVALGEIIGAPMVDVRIPLSQAIVAIASVAVLEIVVSLGILKSPRLKEIVHGSPTVVIENGKVLENNLVGLRYSLSDLLAQLREKGVWSVSDVEFAVLENSGRLTVIQKSQNRPVQAKDLGIATPYEGPSVVLVMDGEVQYRSLKKLGLDLTWLKSELEKQGIKDIKDAMLVTIDSSGRLYVDLRESKQVQYIDGDQLG